MKVLCFALIALASCFATTYAEPIQLFNGSDLTGWQTFVEGNVEGNDVSPDDARSVVSGVIHCTGKGRGYLVTERAYADYVLRLEWRWPEGDGGGWANSGVLLHVVGPDQIWPKAIEAQLKTGNAGDFSSFEDARSDNELVSRNPEGVSTGRLPRKVSTGDASSVENPIGQWNQYEITARGGDLIVKVNGQEVNRMTGVTPSGGHIGLQLEGYAIDFRNVTLESLPPAKDLHAPMPE